jgi:hypothetical protein
MIVGKMVPNGLLRKHNMFYFLLKYFLNEDDYKFIGTSFSDYGNHGIFKMFGTNTCVSCSRNFKDYETYNSYRCYFQVNDKTVMSIMCSRCIDRTSNETIWEYAFREWDKHFKKAIKRNNQKQLDRMIDDYMRLKQDMGIV